MAELVRTKKKTPKSKKPPPGGSDGAKHDPGTSSLLRNDVETDPVLENPESRNDNAKNDIADISESVNEQNSESGQKNSSPTESVSPDVESGGTSSLYSDAAQSLSDLDLKTRAAKNGTPDAEDRHEPDAEISSESTDIENTVDEDVSKNSVGNSLTKTGSLDLDPNRAKTLVPDSDSENGNAKTSTPDSDMNEMKTHAPDSNLEHNKTRNADCDMNQARVYTGFKRKEKICPDDRFKIKTSGTQIQTVMEGSSGGATAASGGSFLNDFLNSFEQDFTAQPLPEPEKPRPKLTVAVTKDVATAVADQEPVKSKKRADSTEPRYDVTAKSKALFPVIKIVKTETLEPFTREQLKSLYYNPLLEQRDAYVDYFFNSVLLDQHEFYEIVHAYYRARVSLVKGEDDVKALQADITRHQDRVWTVEKCWTLVYGVCQDGGKVSQNFEYMKAVYSQVALNNVCQTQRKLQQILQEDLALYTYSASTARLQVESYVHSLYLKCSELRGIPPNAPVQASMLSVRSDSDLGQQMAWLKECISVLFMFHRKPCKDQQFLNDVQKWTTQLVSTLLRVACLEDHVFIINHVLRCPGGIKNWAVPFVQVLPPTLPANPILFASPLLDHCVVILASVLLPIRQREEFLSQMKVLQSPDVSTTPTQPWILVDEDGEEDEDPENSWQMLHENDIVALLDQIPFDAIMRQVLLITADNGDVEQGVYLSSRTSENGMLQLIAFSSCLIDLCGEGLRNYNLGRYRQLNKRIGRMIRHIIQYMTDHWLNVRHHITNKEISERIQLEYDQMFMRATQCILKANRLGSWQFMAEMPYTCVSMTMLWRLMAIMHFDSSDVSHANLADVDDKLQFEEKLTSLPISECIYLLTTFAHMARSRLARNDLDFIKAVAIEIFEISYVSSHTRDLCSKVGRELLSSISTEHTFIMSLLLHITKDVIDKIGNMALYLFKELPFHIWQPDELDRNLLYKWIVDSDIGSVESQLARLVISSINWGYTQQHDHLAVKLSIHRWMALLLVEVSQKRLKQGSFLAGVTAALRQTPTGEQHFSDWLWEIALLLHLHSNSQPQLLLGQTSEFQALDFNKDESASLLRSTALENNTLSCYLALVATSVGHDCDDFCLEGLPFLQELINRYMYRAVIQVLYYILPLHYDNPTYLTENQRFQGILSLLLNADLTYTKMAKNLIFSDLPGQFTKMTMSMIQNQLCLSDAPGRSGVTPVVSFWTKCLTQLPKWQTDRNVCYILDTILQTSFLRESTHAVIQNLFYELFTTFLANQRPGSGLVSVVSWLATGNAAPSLLDRDSMPEFPWLAYYILDAEARYETESGLWSKLVSEMVRRPQTPIEASLKKVATQLKLPISPVSGRLSIYRWANQAKDTAVDHPLLPLMWQRFFVLFLARPPVEQGMKPRGSLGERFFTSRSLVSFRKAMRNRLSAASDYHDKTLALYTDDPEQQPKQNFHLKLSRLYQTMMLWCDESRLHDASLYLPALPAQYKADMLTPLFQNQTTPWMEYFDGQKVELWLNDLVSEWVELRKEPASLQSPYSSVQDTLCPEKATERIFARLKKHAKPVAAPELIESSSPVTDVDTSALKDERGIIYTVNTDLTSLLQCAKERFEQVSRFAVVNCDFQEMLTILNTNEHREATLFLPCTSRLNPTHRCSGPAEVNIEYDEKKRNERVATKMAENRSEYKQLLLELLLPPSQNICSAAVHVDNTIRSLLLLHQTDTDIRIEKSGIALFYHMVTLVNNDSTTYPPTRQFFSSCIEILGQEFVSGNRSQCQTLLECTLAHPNLAGLLAPHFKPSVSPTTFVSMYNHLKRQLNKISSDLGFVLFSKFDVPVWLHWNNPSMSDRTKLITYIGEALTFCGSEPEGKQALLYAIFHGHLTVMASHEFPAHFNHVLNFLLKGSENQGIHAECWQTLTKAFGNLSLTEAPHSNFNIPQLTEALSYLGSYFLQKRTLVTDSACFGLYPDWKRYVPFIGTLLEYLCKTLTTKIHLAVTSGVTDADQGLDVLMVQIWEGFAPWIQPLENGPHLLSPWLDKDCDSAVNMVSLFTECVKTATTLFSDVPHIPLKDPLNFLWHNYCRLLTVEQTPAYVLQTYHSSMLELPWQQFFPSQQCLQYMVKVHDTRHWSCFQFLSSIVFQMPWTTILQTVPAQKLAEIHGLVFRLFLQFVAFPEILAVSGMPQLFQTANDIFQWHHLSAEDFQTAMRWFLGNCEPDCVLAERSDPQAIGISFIKQAAEFVERPDYLNHADTVAKRQSFVHLIAQLLSKCSHKRQLPDAELMKKSVTNLLTQIETIVNCVSDATSQHFEAVTLCTEVVRILNDCNPKPDVAQHFIDAIKDWITSSPSDCILLLPCVAAASQSLASVTHMVVVLEACIDTYFSSADANPSDRWSRLIMSLHGAEMSMPEFLTTGLEYNAFTTLYCSILKRLPLSTSLEDERHYLNLLINWTASAKPGLSDEPKLLLWWAKILELILRQVDFGEEQTKPLHVVLFKFISSLILFGEDKTSAGFMGAIGLGRKSTLSVRFRLVARSLATFLSAQIPNNSAIRVQPMSAGAMYDPQRRGSAAVLRRLSGADAVYPSEQSTQALASLEGAASNKQYAAVKETVVYVCEFVKNPAHCVRDSYALLLQLVQKLFADCHCLDALVNSSR